ncbi:IclR family transcriptional regulator [Streptomyces purpurogeneiscleroticus]|uniref:IclR family transcriptional regulator n=1 Tax=Streptomyces purpurogeneiscleroticus TaxID=68259 RepID=UPI001CC18E7E|nr:IclR family transcriptional regulator [Streptomyces purpurogeneiscleroticus]MBZ4016616.1 IclR family transcriptional regulator [Streptomyces purpurogeneiscleroticus]
MALRDPRAGGGPGRHGGAGRSAADRVLALLGAFDDAHRSLTLTALARRAGLPLATAHRFAGKLTEWGALERRADGRYEIGLRLWEIAVLARRGVGLRQAALPFMEDLYEATHENVQLAVRDGLETVYIELISGRSAVGVRTRVGARWPLHATGVGLALLAYAPPSVVAQVCAAPLRRFTERTIGDPALLRSVLADVRTSGVAVSEQQITMDAVSVAAPVRGPDGRAVAALSVVVPVSEGRAALLAPAVRVAAQGIARSLPAL